jgi:hypothetical protein
VPVRLQPIAFIGRDRSRARVMEIDRKQAAAGQDGYSCPCKTLN